MSTPPDLADRYGRPAPWQRYALLAVSVVLGAGFLGWLGWTAWEHAHPAVRSELIGYEVVDEHRADAQVDVRLRDGDIEATCRLRAYAEDHSVVGELAFSPEESGATEQSVRTERRATSVELVGCTAPGQNRPQ